MRRFTIPVLLTMSMPLALAAPTPATQMVTVAQLEQFVSANRSVNDGKLAVQISDMKLTERLSDADEVRLAKELPGKKSKLALLAIADESAFLDLPPSEIPNLPPPDRATQTALLNKATEYAIHAMKELPNFSATRTTVWFAGTPTVVPMKLHNALFRWTAVPPHGDERLAGTGTTKATVVYRDGREEYGNDPKGNAEEAELSHQCGSNIYGEFGEVLGQAALVATKGTVVWSHWEKGAPGLLAGFRYAGDFIYKFPMLCPNQVHLPPVLIHAVGEMAVDPADGTVLRVSQVWRWTENPYGQNGFQQEIDTMVEYGPIDIDGRNYFCPLKSVSIVFEPVMGSPSAMEHFELKFGLSGDPVTEDVDDITFADYHVFRAEAHILSGDTTQPAAPSTSSPANPPASNPASPPSGLPSAPPKN